MESSSDTGDRAAKHAEIAGRVFRGETCRNLGPEYNYHYSNISIISQKFLHGAKRTEALAAAARYYESNSVLQSTGPTAYISRPGGATFKARKRALDQTLEPIRGGAGSAAAVGSSIIESIEKGAKQDSKESGPDHDW